MTLEEARDKIGNIVIYQPFDGHSEQGVITSVNDRYIFVRYGADTFSKATEASMLAALA